MQVSFQLLKLLLRRVHEPLEVCQVQCCHALLHCLVSQQPACQHKVGMIRGKVGKEMEVKMMDTLAWMGLVRLGCVAVLVTLRARQQIMDFAQTTTGTVQSSEHGNVAGVP